MVDLFNLFKKKQLAEKQANIPLQVRTKGSTGIEIYSGDINEEYLNLLQGVERAKKFDRMRRSDSRVKMCLSAIKNPMKSGDWKWHTTEQDEMLQRHADFLNFIFFHDIGIKRKKKFKRLLSEAFTCADFGYSLFERAHKVNENHREWGSYIGLKSLAWRSPKTIEEWRVDTDGDLTGIRQLSYGDTKRDVILEPDFLSLITIDQEGDNYEGMSLLRPCYGPWHRKQNYLKLMAIGIEKNAIPTPIVDVPEGKAGTEEFDKMIEALEIYTSHQSNYLIKPKGWDFTFEGNEFDPEKTIKAIQFENQEITFAFLANFLELGASNSSGSYALSNDLSDFFMNGIIYMADLVAEEFELVGKELIDINFGPQEQYPKLVHSGITDKIGKEFSEMLSSFGKSGFVQNDDNIEQELRRRMKLPPMPEDLSRKLVPSPTPSNDSTEDNPESQDNVNENDLDNENVELKDHQIRFMLAESRANKMIKKSQLDLREVTQNHLRKISQKMTKDIINKYKSLPEAQKQKAINDIKIKGHGAYRKEVEQTIVDISDKAINEAKREIPKFRNVQLAELKDLPAQIRKLIAMQVGLLTRTTEADLEKIVYFAFGDSMLSSNDFEVIADDIQQAAEQYISSPSVVAASGNVATRVINESRQAFFFNDRVLEEIESFTFANPDPQAPICKSLVGQTVRKTDPMLKRYQPPLHHNCNSYWVANLIGNENPEVTGVNTKYEPTL